MIDILYLILGFVVLFASGRYLVLGGVQLAKLFNIPTLVVGLTIVSFGTSAPELLVSLKAALAGHPDISIGNVVGSNISNMALVLGITALITPLAVAPSLIRFDWIILFVTTVLLLIFAQIGLLVWWQALIFIGILIFFNVSSLYRGKKSGDEQEYEGSLMKWQWSVLIIVISSIGLLFGAEWLVKGATGIAEGLGISERIISVSIIAFGTSVPELATSIVAAIKKEADISIGNIVGSNIFNLAGILGITGLVTPIPIDGKYMSDIIWMLGITILLFMVMVGRRKVITRFEGFFLIMAYSSYLYFLLA